MQHSRDAVFHCEYLGRAPTSFHFHHYMVMNAGSSTARAGALVKVMFDDGSVGFADLMAWPELGDGKLQDEIASLSAIRGSLDRPTLILAQQVLRNSRVDAQARAKNESLWSGKKGTAPSIPKSHNFIGPAENLEALLKDENGARQQSNIDTVVKVKWSPVLNRALIETCPFLLRIDFNERANPEILAELLGSEKAQGKIDFLEDPFRSDAEAEWKWLSENYPRMKIYGDFALEKNSALIQFCKGVVLKPASRNPDKWLNTPHEICVTHSLGHNFGQMIAACYASHLNQPVVSAGLMPAQVVLNSPLAQWQPQHAPAGQGFGYETAELMRLKWEAS